MKSNRHGFTITRADQERPVTSVPLPRGGRIVRRAFANPERLESSQRGMRRSLSLRERVRVRGNETPPTKLAGRILRAQLDRLPEPVTCATQEQVSRHARRTTGVNREAELVFRALRPPHPGPLPLSGGEGECFADLGGRIVILSTILRIHQ